MAPTSHGCAGAYVCKAAAAACSIVGFAPLGALTACLPLALLLLQSCTLAHLLGLFKLRPQDGSDPSGRQLLSWGYPGALADLLLWAFVRV